MTLTFTLLLTKQTEFDLPTTAPLLNTGTASELEGRSKPMK
jgi:hypothetical protein